MAVNRVPVLKRCRSLGLDPVYIGIDKQSNRELKRANKKIPKMTTRWQHIHMITKHLKPRKNNCYAIFKLFFKNLL